MSSYPKIYNSGLVTIGEWSVIPDNVKVGKNTAISGETTLQKITLMVSYWQAEA